MLVLEVFHKTNVHCIVDTVISYQHLKLNIGKLKQAGKSAVQIMIMIDDDHNDDDNDEMMMMTI